MAQHLSSTWDDGINNAPRHEFKGSSEGGMFLQHLLPVLMFMTSLRRAEIPSVPDSRRESPTTRSSSSRNNCRKVAAV